MAEKRERLGRRLIAAPIRVMASVAIVAAYTALGMLVVVVAMTQGASNEDG